MMPSPYQAIDTFETKHGVQSIENQGIALPQSYQSGTSTEIEKTQQHCGILDLKAYSLLSLEGPQAKVFLQGMVTNDVASLNIGECQPNLICQTKGKIRFHVLVLRFAEDTYWVLTEAWEGVAVGNYLHQYHIQEDFKMTMLNPGFVRFDTLGPAADSVAGTEISVALPLGRLPRWIHVVPTEQAPQWLQSQLDQGCHLMGFVAYEQLRIHEGIPQIGVEYGQDNFPQEASLMTHISYMKGCYIGQETHARMYHRGHPNWQLMQIKIPENLSLKAGDAIFHDSQEVGSIKSLSHLVQDGYHHGIARVKHTIAQSETAVFPAETSDIPLQLLRLVCHS